MEWYISLGLCTLFSAMFVFALWQCFFSAYRRHRHGREGQRKQQQSNNRVDQDIIAQCHEQKGSSDLS
jgi:hypothetical protein